MTFQPMRSSGFSLKPLGTLWQDCLRAMLPRMGARGQACPECGHRGGGQPCAKCGHGTECQTCVPVVPPAHDACCCEIPPPPCEPRNLGRITSYLCPGMTMSVRIVLENTRATARTFSIDVTPANGSVKIDPPSVLIGPLGDGLAVVTFSPATAEAGKQYDFIIWVRSCHTFFLRCRVVVGSRGASTCYEVRVADGADYIHHWYDHFYCEHPCCHEAVDHK